MKTIVKLTLLLGALLAVAGCSALSSMMHSKSAQKAPAADAVAEAPSARYTFYESHADW